MITANDVVDAIQGKLSRTMTTILEADQIDACDEENVKSIGKGFIRNYHHFTYCGAGVVACRYIKGKGNYVTHKMQQGSGIIMIILFIIISFFLILIDYDFKVVQINLTS